MTPRRASICYILFLSLLAQTFYQPSILLSYYFNTAAYARNCINKAKPMMHCNGQCLLMKKIREAEKKDTDLPERKFSVNEVFFSGSSFPRLPDTQVALLINPYPHFVSGVHTVYLSSIFHPPSVS